MSQWGHQRGNLKENVETNENGHNIPISTEHNKISCEKKGYNKAGLPQETWIISN